MAPQQAGYAGQPVTGGTHPTGNADWFYSTNGKDAKGPVSAGGLQALAKAGHLQPTDLIWKVGMAQWAWAGAATGLFGNDSSSIQTRQFRDGFTLEAREVTVAVGRRCLLKEVSLVICPGELVGLMGASGAGKTTLLSALNGYEPPTVGEVVLNGQSLYACYREFAGTIGYVPQDDIIHRELTVSEALYYSARLRLPRAVTDEEIGTRIRAVLRSLELEGTEDLRIGSPERRGISGGQRKRVNLGMELLTDPSVLFLDEPTSGLSSQDAEVVMKVLRALADQGKTVLVTIHQPSLAIFRLLNNLALLVKDGGSREPGRLAYYGRAYPDAAVYFGGSQAANDSLATPEEILQALGQRPAAEWNSLYRASAPCRSLVLGRSWSVGDRPVPTDVPEKPAQSRVRQFAYQWRTLVRRGLTIKLRDRMSSAILLIQSPLVAALIVLVFGKQIDQVLSSETWSQISRALGTSLFVMTLAAVWFGCSNAVREVVGEWSIYRRERMVSLSIPAYLASKITVLGALAVIQCSMLLAITYPGCHLQGSILLHFLLLLSAALIGVAIGLILSAIARSSEVAIALSTVVLLAMVIVGGALQPIHRMHEATQYLAAVNPCRWCFEGMIVLESDRRPAIPDVLRSRKVSQARDDMAEYYFPRASHRSSVGACAGMLLLILTAATCVSPLILRHRDLRSMKGHRNWKRRLVQRGRR